MRSIHFISRVGGIPTPASNNIAIASVSRSVTSAAVVRDMRTFVTFDDVYSNPPLTRGHTWTIRR